MYKKPYNPNFKKFIPTKSKRRFKVRGPIKSFRDLDVYNKSTALSAEIFVLEISQDLNLKKLDNEIEILRDLSKYIPKMIAESYGNRFDNFSVAERKLEKTAEIISAVISKIDFIVSIIKKIQEKQNLNSVSEEDEKNKKTKTKKQKLNEEQIEETKEFKNRIELLLKDYSILRMKVLNLKRAWIKINQNIVNKKYQ